MSVGPGDRVPVVVSCLAGCPRGAVIDALRERHLWPEAERRNGHAPSGVASMTRFEIKDAAGTLVAVHVRTDQADGSKSFAWRQPGGAAGLAGVRTADLPLFGSELLRYAAPGSRAVLVEGEKAAQALRGRGILAVASVTGASGAPSRASLAVLRDFGVVLWPDNDLPGRDHMNRIAQTLLGLGISPRLVNWPGAPAKGDAADFVGSDVELAALLGAAAAWQPAATEAPGAPEPAGPPHSAATDLANAERFARQHGAEWRYCAPWRTWVGWTGQRWQTDDTLAVVRAASETVRTIYAEAAAADDSAMRRVLAGWAARSESADRLRAMLDLARSRPGAPVRPDEFDR
ncbi:MAG: hypothetical protein IT307_00860, partial [Chloroflexi bacterium]|nr:hypothetical protein [Chloroflexota bacterium]